MNNFFTRSARSDNRLPNYLNRRPQLSDIPKLEICAAKERIQTKLLQRAHQHLNLMVEASPSGGNTETILNAAEMRDFGGSTMFVHKLLITEAGIARDGERWRITAECTVRRQIFDRDVWDLQFSLETGETAASAGIVLRPAIQDF